jgi:hypothetical protein
VENNQTNKQNYSIKSNKISPVDIFNNNGCLLLWALRKIGNLKKKKYYLGFFSKLLIFRHGSTRLRKNNLVGFSKKTKNCYLLFNICLRKYPKTTDPFFPIFEKKISKFK